jgi:hypothetical protein
MFKKKLYYWTSLLTAFIIVGGLTSCHSKPKTPNHQTKIKVSRVRYLKPLTFPHHKQKLLTRKNISIYIGRYHATAAANGSFRTQNCQGKLYECNCTKGFRLFS